MGYSIYGIYLDGGLCYVGSTSNNLAKRFKQHCDDKRRALGKLIRELGRDKFSIKLICYLGEVSRKEAYSVEEAITRCRKNLGFNLLNVNCGASPSEEARIRLSKHNSGYKHTKEAKQKMSNSRRGKPKSEECRNKIASSHIGIKPTQETREKMRLAKLGTKHEGKPVYCIELDMAFDKLCDLADYLGVSHSAVSNCVCGRNETVHGYHVVYI